MVKFFDRLKGDALALIVLGAATCSGGKILPQAAVLPDGTSVRSTPRVVFDSSLVNMFEFGYFLSQKAYVENAWCLHGIKKDDVYEVHYARTPFVHEAGPHHIKVSCIDNDDFLGIAHTHDSRVPENNPCSHSPNDIVGFMSEPQYKVSAVYCGKGLISTITK